MKNPGQKRFQRRQRIIRSGAAFSGLVFPDVRLFFRFPVFGIFQHFPADQEEGFFVFRSSAAANDPLITDESLYDLMISGKPETREVDTGFDEGAESAVEGHSPSAVRDDRDDRFDIDEKGDLGSFPGKASEKSDAVSVTGPERRRLKKAAADVVIILFEIFRTEVSVTGLCKNKRIGRDASGEIILRFKIPAGRTAVKKSEEKTAVPVNDADRRSVRLLFSGDDDHFRDAVIKAGFFRRDAADPAGPAVSVIRFPGR